VEEEAKEAGVQLVLSEIGGADIVLRAVGSRSRVGVLVEWMFFLGVNMSIRV